MRLARSAALAAAAVLTLPAAASASGGHRRLPAVQRHARLQLVLPLVGNQAGLTRLATAVSTPSSPEFGQYRSVAWLARHFGASPSTRRRVVGYLSAHGATDVSADATGQFVYAAMSRARAQRVFGITRGRTAHLAAADPAAAIPHALRGSVTAVIGLDTAPAAVDTLPPSSGYQGPDPDASPSGCGAGVRTTGFTPNEYLDAYGYSPLHQQGLLGQGERVALVEIDGFRARDLAAFADCFHLGRPQVRADPVGVGAPLAPGGEATLDLEVLDAAAPDLKAVDVYETSPDAADVLKALAQPLQSTGFEPQVISVSLGLCEANTVEGVGMAEIRATETVLKLAAAAGISVLGASGDFGSTDCPDINSRPPSPLALLAVNFPSSSPWVTSVGGTNFELNAQNQIVSQTVWNDGSMIPGSAAGGGFSQLFSRPSWQDGVVSSPWRAQPDVAMLADVSPGYDVYCTAVQDCHGRGWVTFGGTSAATPLVAGGFALIDEMLRRNDHASLGLANPLLYRLGRNPATAAQVFYDVTQGSNDVGPFIRTSQQPIGCCSAQPGYDEASGWGGVNLDALASAALGAQRLLPLVSISLPGGQRPYARRGIYAIVGCTAACDAAAYARVTVRGGKPFTAYSNLVHLVHRNRRRVEVLFTTAELREIGAALGAHRQVSAQVAGAIVDPGGNIETHTVPQPLRITS